MRRVQIVLRAISEMLATLVPPRRRILPHSIAVMALRYVGGARGWAQAAVALRRPRPGAATCADVPDPAVEHETSPRRRRSGVPSPHRDRPGSHQASSARCLSRIRFLRRSRARCAAGADGRARPRAPLGDRLRVVRRPLFRRERRSTTVRLSPRVRSRLAGVDHAGVYLLIAGSYTPFALLVFSAGWAVPL